MESEVKKNDMPLKVLVNVSRVLLGLMFIFSGVVKAVDPMGTQIKLSDYLYAFGMGGVLLDSTLLILACLLAGVEIIIGAYLLTGVFGKGTSLVALVIMGLFTPFTLYIAIFNPVEECGCFGDALILTNTQTFVKNLFLLLLALLIFIKRNLIVPFVTLSREWMVTLFVVAITIRFMTANIAGLPLLDFRPYKRGTDLKTKVLVEHDPQMADFYLMDSEYNDVTQDVLMDSGYTFLLVASHIEDASDNNIDLVYDLADYCGQWGYKLLGVTASGRDAIKSWNENVGFDLEFLHCDEIPLQTMVRSNPGLVLLNNGMLVNKWSHASIPSDEELTAPLCELAVGQIPEENPLGTPWAVMMLFMMPLLLIVLIDWLKRLIQ